ncbi:hypothetical protein Goklo_006617, partial [Gossypium klotzschianum]|nr:hypothetical protein [Gossypium klotzschianum]
TTLYANSYSQQHFDTGGLSRESFPEGFLFGTAALAYQVEGMASKDGRGPSIWDAFVKTPGHIANNDTGEVFIDQYHRYKTFGDTVKTWMTFNEPRVVSALSFDNGINPPNRCSKQFGNCTDGNSATETYIAAHHLILSHAEAVKTYREKY